MAFKLVNRDEPAKQSPKKTGGIAQGISDFVRPYTALPLRAAEGLIGAPQDIYSGVAGLANKGISALTGKENVLPSELPILPSSQSLRENVTNKYIAPLYPEGYLEPQNFTEKVAQGVASDPTVALRAGLTGGASLPVDLGRSAFANTGIQAAKSAGFGPMGQFLSGVLGGVGFDLKRIGKTPGQLPKIAENLYKKNYETARSVAPLVQAPATSLSSQIDSLLDQVGTGLNTAGNRNARKILASAGSKINSKSNTISAKDLWDLKKELGSLIGDHSISPHEKSYYKQLFGTVAQELDQVGTQNPSFGVPYKKAEDLYKAVNVRSEIGNMIENNTGLQNLFKNKTTKALLGYGLGKAFGVPGLIGTIPLSYGARYTARVADFFKGHPEAQNLMREALSEAANSNTAGFVGRLKTLKQEYDAYQPEPGKRNTRFKKIS